MRDPYSTHFVTGPDGLTHDLFRIDNERGGAWVSCCEVDLDPNGPAYGKEDLPEGVQRCPGCIAHRKAENTALATRLRREARAAARAEAKSRS